MPVQINEVVIRANIVNQQVKQTGAKAGANSGAESDVNKDEIIKECTELILEILKTNAER